MAELKEYVFKSDESHKYESLFGKEFIIPYQQRTYKWRPAHAEMLLKDLKEFVNPSNPKTLYCMQPLAVCQNEEGKWLLLDGQQRLTTFLIIHRILFEWNDISNAPFVLDHERDGKETCASDKSLHAFLYGDAFHNSKIKTSQDLYNMSDVKHFVEEWLDTNQDVKEQLRSLFEPGGKELLFLWYEVAFDDCHQVFRNLNSGKIPLTNAELVKALLLSDNYSGISDKNACALQFREMEMALEDNRFWYAICPYDSDPTHPRIDFLFNLVAGISPATYWSNDDGARASFDYLYENKGRIQAIWDEVRENFVRLTDLYKDSRAYHYMGFLTYYPSSQSRRSERKASRYKDQSWIVSGTLQKYKELGFEECINSMKQTIKEKLELSDNLPGFDEKAQCRRVFVLHNIETILSRLNNLAKVTDSVIRQAAETFPFELLYSQDWDIEHIASQTENDLTGDKDRDDFLKGLKSDYPGIYKSHESMINDFRNKSSKQEKTKAFNELYKSVIEEIEKEMTDKGLTPVVEKDAIGNLVLLDSHTNRSYHNSLMPRKRHIILFAAEEGLPEENIKVAYIPLCTLKVFQKAYNKSTSDISSLDWIQQDADAYTEDMKTKLKFYLS